MATEALSQKELEDIIMEILREQFDVGGMNCQELLAQIKKQGNGKLSRLGPEEVCEALESLAKRNSMLRVEKSIRVYYPSR